MKKLLCAVKFKESAFTEELYRDKYVEQKLHGSHI
jgi:hypothetical protein